MATAESQFSFAFGDPDAELNDDALIRQWSAAEGQWAAVGSDHLLVHIAKHTPLVEKTEEGAFNVDRNLASHVLGRAAAIGGIGNLSANLMLSDRLLTNVLQMMVTEGRMVTSRLGKHWQEELICRVAQAVACCGLYDTQEEEPLRLS